MGLQDHKRDYIVEFPPGRIWQIGTRSSLTNRTSDNSSLVLGAMSWRGKEWQLGSVVPTHRRKGL